MRKFSNSEIQTYKRCRRKWYLQWFRGLRPRVVGPTGVMSMGDRFHRALAAGYGPGGPHHDQFQPALEAAILEDQQAYTRNVNELLSHMSDLQFQDLDLDMTTFSKENDLLRIMMQGYIQWIEETGLDSDFEIVGSEVYVEHEFYPGVSLIGKIDYLVRNIVDGTLRFLDHKTVSNFTSSIDLRRNQQMLHYLVILSMQEKEVPVGAYFNMIRRVKRTASAKPPFYLRVEVPYSRLTLSSYMDQLTGVVREIKNLDDDLRSHSLFDSNLPWTARDFVDKVYPTPTRDCSWDCPFYKVCDMVDDGSRFEDAISDQFESGNPLDYYGDVKPE